MKDFKRELLNEDNFLLFIYTPLCGTCNLARSMLYKIEMAHDQQLFYQMNASFYPEVMQQLKITSVPCLLIQTNGEIKEKIYAFHSVPNIYYYLLKHCPDLLKMNDQK